MRRHPSSGPGTRVTSTWCHPFRLISFHARPQFTGEIRRDHKWRTWNVMFATVAGAARCGKTLRRLVRRSSKSEGGRNPCLHSAAPWIASRSLSSGARSRDPLARNDDVEAVGATNQPDGQINKICPSLSRKNIPLNAVGQISGINTRVSRQMRGGSRSSRTCGGMRWTRSVRKTSAHERTAKSCGPDAAVLASSCVGSSFCSGDGGKRAVHRGEHEVSRKATAQGRPECFR